MSSRGDSTEHLGAYLQSFNNAFCFFLTSSVPPFIAGRLGQCLQTRAVGQVSDDGKAKSSKVTSAFPCVPVWINRCRRRKFHRVFVGHWLSLTNECVANRTRKKGLSWLTHTGYLAPSSSYWSVYNCGDTENPNNPVSCWKPTRKWTFGGKRWSFQKRNSARTAVEWSAVNFLSFLVLFSRTLFCVLFRETGSTFCDSNLREESGDLHCSPWVEFLTSKEELRRNKSVNSIDFLCVCVCVCVCVMKFAHP